MNFIEIPNKIESKVKAKIHSKIPKNIIQVYKYNRIHPHIYNSIMKMLDKNPDYNYYFITYDICEELIKQHFDENTLIAYNKIKVGAAKADFIRYITLYIYGGIYLDLDASIEIELSKFILSNIDYIFFYRFVEDVKIVQWLIMTKPKNFIMKQIIDEMVRRINMNNETNIFLATGPTLFTDVIYNLIFNTNVYDYLKHSTLLERKTFCLDVLSRVHFDGIFYDMCEYTEQFKFRMPGYTTSMLYVDEERFNRNSNIFIANPKMFHDSTTQLISSNEPDNCFVQNQNEIMISLYKNSKRLIYDNITLAKIVNTTNNDFSNIDGNHNQDTNIEISKILSEMMNNSITINEIIYNFIKH
uniref:Glycosyltransferase n=1 Tax=viral metagenome TaxID=1070528 RepID=A0A6C0HBN9_9ZZZZ